MLQEVRVLFTRDGLVTQELSFDPAKVRTLVWDPVPHRILQLDRENVRTLDPAILRSALRITPAGQDRPAAGVAFPIYVNVAREREDDSWWKIEGAEIHGISVKYHDNRGSRPQWYERYYPVTSSDNSVNRGQEWKDDPNTESIDMMFWHAAQCARFREAKVAAGKPVNPHRFIKPDGSPHQGGLRPQPIEPEQPHSVACGFCVHRVSCNWECTAN
ncbi:MAG TPA: hypothetical protein VF021_04480 [Longimicrobiales bacterium]